MEYKFEYKTIEEKQSIISSHPNLILKEEQNIISGNFLIFSDTPPIEIQLQNIQNNTDMLLLKQEGII